MSEQRSVGAAAGRTAAEDGRVETLAAPRRAETPRRAGAPRRAGTRRRGAALSAVVAFAATIVAALSMAGAAWASGHEVVSWGSDVHGQLGDSKEGALYNSNVPVYVCAVSGCSGGHLTEVIAISAGGEHSLALLSSGEVVAWGRGEEGALGDGGTANSDLPRYVCAIGSCSSHLKEVIAIAAGDDNSNLALLKNGQVVSWGSNKSGQLGNGTPASLASYKVYPVNVCAPRTTFTACSSSEYLEHVISISTAPDHDAAIMQPGDELLTWGVNNRGQLGQGDWNTYDDIPEHVCEVEYPYIGKVVPNTLPHCHAGHYLIGVEEITFGLEHNIAQFTGSYCAKVKKQKDAVKIAGHKEKGEGEGEGEGKGKGKGEEGEGEGKEGEEKCKGRSVKDEEEYEWVEEYATASVVAFGNNEEGQLGDGLAVEEHHYYSPHEGGPAYCIKVGGYETPCSQVPIHVCEPEFGPLSKLPCGFPYYLEPVKQVSAGGSHSLALQSTGEVVDWGENKEGELGLNEHTGPQICSFASQPCDPVPQHVLNPSGHARLTGIAELSGGGYHNLALESSSEVLAWGKNVEGQLGDGHFAAESDLPIGVCEPVLVACPHSLSGATAVSAGLNHSLALGKFPVAVEPCPWCKALTGGTSTTTAVAKIGEPFVGPLHAGGGEPPYHWSVSTGALPEGLTLNETGVISGTPTKLGTSTFTVEVVDSSSPTPESASETFTITVTATPSIGRCVKVGPVPAGTTYTNSSCTQPSAGGKPGQYEWLPGVEKARFATSGEKVTLETVAKQRLTCAGESGGGEYVRTGAVGDVMMRFTGCESAGQACTTAGAREGEIQTNALEGVYGWEAQPTKVALDLYPDGGTGALLEYSCAEGVPVTVTGSVLVPVTADKMLTTTSLKYKGSKGHQKPESFEESEPDVLISSIDSGTTQAALTLTETQVNEEPVEINTVA